MKLFATFLTCLFIFQTAFGQTSKPDSLHLSFDSLDISPESGSTLTLPPADDLVKIIPPSPNSAAIEQFISQPVSLHTGIPDINIPIYEIRQGSLRV